MIEEREVGEMKDRREQAELLVRRLTEDVAELERIGFKVSVLEGFQDFRKTETEIKVMFQPRMERVVIEEISK